MFKRISLVFLLLSMVLCLGSSIEPAQSNVQAKRIVVAAAEGWQDSGVVLKAGQYYAIDARGSWVSGLNQPFEGPDGRGWGTLTNGALLGWISDKKPERLGYDSYTHVIIRNIILIARGGLFKAAMNGRLWLCRGDWSECKECTGEVEVLITLYE